MKASRKAKRGVTVAQPEISQTVVAQSPTIPHWLWALLAVYACAFFVYSPALNGEFVFDDLHMLFVDPNAMTFPLHVWWGVRPLLMTTYWANLHLATGPGTFAYHAVNVFFHATAAIFLFFVLRRILQWASPDAGNADSRLDLLAAFGAAVFLLHPIQTEAVSYVTQRGEDMGAMLYFAAFCVFLYRKPGPVSWPTTAAIVALYGAAVVTKEHTVTLPALLLLTDYFFSPGFTFAGIKRNWRLYLTLGICFLIGIVMVLRLLKADTKSVGFQLEDFNAFQYLFTEFRVFFVYIGLFLYPLTQTIDYDFSISKTILDHGSIIALALILFFAVAAFLYRRNFPLASYGFLAFCILLLPTSSIVPIRDPIADRRLYLPIIGLLLISIELLRHLRIGRTALIAVLSVICLLLGAATYRRNEKWSTAIALWDDAAEKAPNKSRVQFGLAASEFLAKRCRESIPHYQKAIALSKPDYQLYMNIAMAYNCDHQPAEAVEYLRKSIQTKPTAQSWASLALVQAQQGQLDEPMEALKQAEVIDPRYPLTYVFRVGLLQATGRTQEAIAQFQHALDLDPNNYMAKSALNTLRR